MSGWMEWTILPGTAEERMDHPEHLREITVRVPVGVDVLLGARIMQGASGLISLLCEAWEVEGTPMLRVREEGYVEEFYGNAGAGGDDERQTAQAGAGPGLSDDDGGEGRE